MYFHGFNGLNNIFKINVPSLCFSFVARNTGKRKKFTSKLSFTFLYFILLPHYDIPFFSYSLSTLPMLGGKKVDIEMKEF